jgi:patatin-like phospholipase/acyl hydrolase
MPFDKLRKQKELFNTNIPLSFLESHPKEVFRILEDRYSIELSAVLNGDITLLELIRILPKDIDLKDLYSVLLPFL